MRCNLLVCLHFENSNYHGNQVIPTFAKISDILVAESSRLQFTFQ